MAVCINNFHIIINYYFITLFFGAKKRDKRNIHPNQTFPYMGRLNRDSPSLFH